MMHDEVLMCIVNVNVAFGGNHRRCHQLSDFFFEFWFSGGRGPDDVLFRKNAYAVSVSFTDLRSV
jgi:hypothetical protein